jgi:HEAT repeat protein
MQKGAHAIMRNAILTFTLAGVLFLSAVLPALAQDADPLAVLKSDADLKAKQDACITLSIHGGPEAIPVLEGMLGDAQLSHMARYVLEPMPYPEAGAALRNALATTGGALKVGILNSLANRRDTECVPAVITALSDADPAVAQEAARSLGVIATPECANALTSALPQADAGSGMLHAVCDGMLRCAEAFVARGNSADAIALYDRLCGVPNAAHEVRTGAVRGAVLARGPQEGLPVLLEAVHGEDAACFKGALRTAREMDGGDAVTAALAEALPALSAERKIALMQVLGHRGGSAAGPVLLAEAQAGPEDVRVAAVNALTRLAYTPALRLIAELAAAEDAPLTQAARNALAYFPAPDGDAVLMAMLDNPGPAARRVAVELIGKGGLPEPVGPLMDAAEKDADVSVRLTALTALQKFAGIPEMPRLLAMLRKAQAPEEMQGAEDTLRAVVDRERKPTSAGIVIQKAVYGDLPGGASADVTEKVTQMVASGAMAIGASNANFGDTAQGVVKQLRVEYTANGVPHSKTVTEGQSLNLTAVSIPPAIVDGFREAFEQARSSAPQTALALVRLMGATGSPKALETVHLAAARGEGEIKQAAERALCDWPTPDALPVVMDMARTAPDATLKVLALRGAVRMLKESEATPAERLNQLTELMALASTPDEKKQVLSGLAVTPSLEALEMVFAQFADEAVRPEAVQAAIAIAQNLGASAREDAAIFNGNDLTGWTGTGNYWRVEDGAIVGQSTEQIPDTGYLWSELEAGDFYFCAEVLLEPPTANSGIQFRSKKIDEAGHALGYQGDIGQGVWGRLYHQGGRAMLDWNGRAEEAVKPGEWNRFEILAVGPAIWTAINGKLGVACLDLAAKDERTGKFAFQMHAGAPQTHRYRNIKLIHNPKIELGELKADALIPELTIPK